jgi:hypothetical protein
MGPAVFGMNPGGPVEALDKAGRQEKLTVGAVEDIVKPIAVGLD